MREPLVSIIIPAYNAEKWIAYTLRSAVEQTWTRKEVIVVNDGSTDRTAEIAKQFESRNVTVITTCNRGLSAAVNHALRLAQGDYIQELDSDDLLAPEKIELQLLALRDHDEKWTALSSPWAYFHFRTRHATFVRNSLWEDLTPAEFLIRKMGENLHMQNATWLLSREITEAAGPWDETLEYDQDGEYFSRALLASKGTHFVPEGRIFYRINGSNRISYIGNSIKKRESLLRSMKLHIKYLRSVEESDRAKSACLIYLNNWSEYFELDTPEMFAELQSIAKSLGGQIDPPILRKKYAWLESVFGHRTARWAQRTLPEKKNVLVRSWDGVMFKIENRKAESIGEIYARH